MSREFKLPDLGEKIEGVDIIAVLVEAGDTIKAGSSLLEVVTDKAVFEIPTDVDMIVADILVHSGDHITVGQPLFIVNQVEKETPPPSTPAPTASEPCTPGAPVPPAPPVSRPAHLPEPPSTPPKLPKGVLVPAAPSVRREARELGVRIEQVPGTGLRGRISVGDVRNFVKRGNLAHSAAPHAPPQEGLATPSHAALPDFTRWGKVTREKMGHLRRATAFHLAATWNTVPQVTQFDKADITELEILRKHFAPRVEKGGGGKLSLTAILIKTVAVALKVFPAFNASVDLSSEELILKHYIHIGVAVDTPRGLIVPVIRDIDSKNIIQLSTDLATLAQKARTRKIMPEEMTGGCFTISNLGGVGGIGFTPIVNHPEVAILGVARSTMEGKYVDGALQPRLMLPLSLSYDHRVVDGADGARFLRWICEALEQPMLLALEG